jgi:PAS domain S-box-containing protein
VRPVATGANGEERRVLAADAKDPLVAGTARYLRTRPDILEQLPKAATQAFSFDVPALGEIHAAAKSFQIPGAFSWTVVAALPAADFLGPVRYAMFLSIALSVFLVALAWLLGFWAVGLALRPLTTLTQAARSISRGEWPDVPEVQRNDEIGVLARAFRLMTASLKETQDGLRRSEENYRGIFENAPEGIVRTTPDGRVLSANPAIARKLGYASPEQLIAEARNIREQVWADPHARDAAISTLLLDGVIDGYEAEFRRKDGQRIWVLLSSHLVDDSPDEPFVIETFIRDISDRKRADEALHHAREELARITRVAVFGEMTASIAHEIRQPLTGIVSNAYACLRWLAAQPPSMEEARRSVERIVRDGHRADEVMQRIRALFQETSPRSDWSSVNDLIVEVVALTRSEADRSRVSLTTELSGDLPRVKADRIQLQQVIVNLIMNAIEASSVVDEGPREVLVSSGWDGSRAVLVAVSDSGTGLEPEQLDRVFDAFYTTKFRGMGMGLTISRSIVEAHGGRLWVTANAPRGAVFQFTLPAEGEQG